MNYELITHGMWHNDNRSVAQLVKNSPTIMEHLY